MEERQKEREAWNRKGKLALEREKGSRMKKKDTKRDNIGKERGRREKIKKQSPASCPMSNER